MIVSNEATRNELYLGRGERNKIRGIRRPSFRFSDIWKAPLNDFPIRDEILYQYLRLSPDMDVLEIGPGSGFTAFRLARQVRSLTLVDVAAKSLAEVSKQLRPFANVRCVCVDPTKPGMAGELKRDFDATFALDVFEYLVNPATCLRNFAEVLRQNGELFLTYPNVLPPVGDGVTYFSREADLAAMLGQAGFRRWEIFATRLRPHAFWIYRVMHEYPLQIYRGLRKGNPNGHPQTYEASWVFKHLENLEHCKIPLHSFWFLLDQAMRIGGEMFAAQDISDGICGRQLVIRAWK